MELELLRRLIATPSTSREESATADIIASWLEERGISTKRLGNNVIAYSEGFDPDARPTLLLNSHHDTVKPSPSYTRNPYEPTIEDGKLYGLGSNDAGGSVVGLISLFHHYHKQTLPFNLLLAITAEEEVMGEGGIRSLGEELNMVDMALVGEPTLMQAAIGERGLVVLDCIARGKSGHAARGEGINALYKAVEDITKLRNFRFERCSKILGEINIATTMIEAGTQHNVVPDSCHFVVDLRTTDAYTNEQVVEILAAELESEIKPRSTRIRASALDESHPLLCAARKMGAESYISPTTSDMALMSYPSLKMGIGDSARSHTADEYLYVAELEEGVKKYKEFIKQLINYYETME
ncbi:MAG: M20 family metallo-hydrolase [Rikenellaceae bacterium]